MFQFRMCVVAMVLAAVTCIPTLAQQTGPEAGAQSVGLTGTIITGSGDTRTVLGAEYAVLTASQVEVGGRVGWILKRKDNPGRVQLGIFGRYRFVSESNTVPYVTLGAGYVLSRKDEKGTFTLQGGLGVEGFVSERTALFAEAQAWKGLRRGNDTHAWLTLGVKFYLP